MEREGAELLRNSTRFQEFTVTGNHHHPPPPDAAFFSGAANHYLQCDTENHHQQPNSNSNGAAFWAVGNQLSASDYVTAAFNHQQHINDFLPAAAARNQLNSNNLAVMNGNTVNISPCYTDTLLESEFARLGLMPSVRPPAFVGAAPDYGGGIRSSGGGASSPHLRDVDMRQMRIQSAARGQVGFYVNSDIDELYMNGGNLNGISTYDSPNLYNSGNLNGYHSHNQAFRNDLGLESSSNYRSLAAADRIQVGNSVCRPRQWKNLTSLKDLRGKIFAVATDQHGCRFLQSKIEEGKPEEIQMIFMEVKDRICELMVDEFGNYMVQKFLPACNQEQMTQLLLSVISDEHRFMDICVDAHGSRCVQRLLEFLTTAEQRSLVISVLRRITLPLTKSMNGHHVIQYFLKFYSVEDKKHILNVVADHCMEIATDKSGCCVLQQCVEHAVGDPRHRLISEITSNALMLSEHPYGNYVVQYILGLKNPHATADIIAHLCGNIVSLSMSKYGSNVVEKFLKDPEITQETQIIEELIYSPHFLRVLQDPFGNYVAQSAFAASKGALRSAMISLIQANNQNLHSHPHGKRVLQCIKGNKIRV